MQHWCHKKHYLDQEKLRQTNRLKYGMTMKKYSITLLLLGSMTYPHLSIAAATNAQTASYDALKNIMIAEFALAYHDTATALHNYTVLAIKLNSTAIKQRALNIAIAENDLQAALDIATHWVVQEPEDVPALFYLAHIALRAHEYELAAETLDKILAIDASTDLEQVLAGIVPEGIEDRNNLLDTLRSSQAKDNPSVLVLIAGVEAQNGQFDIALQNINRALKKRPKNSNFILLKANLLEALGDEAALLQWYKKISRQQPNNLNVRLAHVKYLIKINQTEQALKLLEAMLKLWPDNEETLFTAGLISIDLEQYDKAERYLVELRTSEQYRNDAYYYLAINAERKQHYETAKAYFRLVDGSLYTVSRRNLVNIFEQQQRLTEGLRFLTQERVNYPQHASFLYQLQAEILVRLENKKAAIGLLDEAIKTMPDDPELLYAQVLLLNPHEQQMKLDQALKRLLQIEPNSPTYLNAYAYTLALQNVRLPEARRYAERALEFAPEQASILDTYGYITYLQSDFATALPTLEKAYALRPNLKIGIRYAHALYMQGELEKFQQILQQLQQNFPNEAQLATLEALLLIQSE